MRGVVRRLARQLSSSRRRHAVVNGSVQALRRTVDLHAAAAAVAAAGQRHQSFDVQAAEKTWRATDTVATSNRQHADIVLTRRA